MLTDVPLLDVTIMDARAKEERLTSDCTRTTVSDHHYQEEEEEEEEILLSEDPPF